MTRLDLHDAQPEFTVDRRPDGDVQLQVRADGVDVCITIGGLYGDVSLLAESLHHLADDVDTDILHGWHDVADEFDGYIGFDRGRYHVSLDGSRIGDYPSREVAGIELARAMVDGGVFPNVWFITDHGDTEPIDADIRRWHDDGGDQMAPLAGVQYQPGDRVWYADVDWPHVVVGDWGRPAWKSTPRAIRASGPTSPIAPSCGPTPTEPKPPKRGPPRVRPPACIPCQCPSSGHPTDTTPRGIDPSAIRRGPAGDVERQPSP